MPNLNDALRTIHSLQGAAAVKTALASYLRFRYLSRDSSDAIAQIKDAEGRPVSESVIEAEARALESEAKEMMKTINAMGVVEVADE